MPRDNADMTLDELATLADGVAHPIRVAILRALREKSPMSKKDLRRVVSDAYMEIDTRTVQFHLYKMHVCGLVQLSREGGREIATLVKDVQLRTKAA